MGRFAAYRITFMSLNVVIVALITVVLAIVATDPIDQGRLAEATNS